MAPQQLGPLNFQLRMVQIRMNGTQRGAKATGLLSQASLKARMPSYPRPNFMFLLVFLAFVVARYISINERMDLLRTIRAEFILGMFAMICAGMRVMMQPPAIGKSRPLILWIVGMFLAILELLRHHDFRAEQPVDFGEIWILPPAGDAAPDETEHAPAPTPG